MSTIKFQIAAVNALRQSMDSADIVAIDSIRENIKASDLKEGDLIVNIMTQRVEAIDSIDRHVSYLAICLSVPSNIQGGQFVIDSHDRIDVYRA